MTTIQQQLAELGEPKTVEITDDWVVSHMPPGWRMMHSCGWYFAMSPEGTAARAQLKLSTAIDRAWYLYNGTGSPQRPVARVFWLQTATGELRRAQAFQQGLFDGLE